MGRRVLVRRGCPGGGGVAVRLAPRAFTGAPHHIDPAMRAFAAIHSLPLPVTWV